MWALANAGGGFGGVITKDFKERDRTTMAMVPDVMGIAMQNPGPKSFSCGRSATARAGNYGVEILLRVTRHLTSLWKCHRQSLKRR